MPSEPIILLDTPIVAGSFAVSKKGNHVESEKILWRNAVKKLASSVSSKYLIRVPTPVCYELMAMNKQWFDFIYDSQSDVFRYSHVGISNEYIVTAAEYSFSTICTYHDGTQQKMKTMDPLIAAYCIKGNHYLLTTNQQDFPESHFTVIGTEIMVLSGQNGKYRSIIYLLKPNPPHSP